MGQAKRRGTREQRIERALEVQRLAREIDAENQRQEQARREEEQRRREEEAIARGEPPPIPRRNRSERAGLIAGVMAMACAYFPSFGVPSMGCGPGKVRHGWATGRGNRAR